MLVPDTLFPPSLLSYLLLASRVLTQCPAPFENDGNSRRRRHRSSPPQKKLTVLPRGGVPDRARRQEALLRPSSTSTTPPSGGRRAPEPPCSCAQRAPPCQQPGRPRRRPESSPVPGRRESALHRVPASLPRRLRHLRPSQVSSRGSVVVFSQQTRGLKMMHVRSL